MKAVGITAEYNPLHNGHIYHIEQSRLLSNADAVVAAMSGNFVQRGEPAILDKWTRTEHALRCGADLVVEIPTLYCLGNSSQYASAAVAILEATGKVTHISFGSESGDMNKLRTVSRILDDHSEEIERAVRDMRSSGLSYPAAREAAYAGLRKNTADQGTIAEEDFNGEISILRNPNDILALEYIRTMKDAMPLAVMRRGAGYSDSFARDAEFQSASALRSMVAARQDISGYVPECVGNDLRSGHITDPDRDGWWDTLRYALLTAETETIEDCPSGGEGLANLLRSEIADTDITSWSGFLQRIKTRRYTYTRLSRLCMQIVLGITRSRYADCGPGYIRVLGFNDTGRQLLAEMKREDSAKLPVITNINKESGHLPDAAARLLALDIHASDIYNLMTGRSIREYSDHRQIPVTV